MRNQEVISDDSGIIFFPDTPRRYRIMWWQIRNDGFDKWFGHLCEKSWFNDTLEMRFMILCMNNGISIFKHKS